MIDAEKIRRFDQAVELARQQRDPASEVCVDFQPETAGEGLVLQEFEKLWDVLGVEAPDHVDYDDGPTFRSLPQDLR